MNQQLNNACSEGDIETVRQLLNRGVDVNKKDDREGWTALHFAIFEEHKEIIKLLLDNGADINQEDNEGWTALYVGSDYIQKEIVELLVTRKADFNQDDNEQLIAACSDGDIETVKQLHNHGVDVYRLLKGDIKQKIFDLTIEAALFHNNNDICKMKESFEKIRREEELLFKLKNLQ
jgi:Ankyrin repeats (3 copies)